MVSQFELFPTGNPMFQHPGRTLLQGTDYLFETVRNQDADDDDENPAQKLREPLMCFRVVDVHVVPTLLRACGGVVSCFISQASHSRHVCLDCGCSGHVRQTPRVQATDGKESRERSENPRACW